MAIRKTLQIGDPRLKGDNKIVHDFKNPQIRGVIQDCIDTMHENGLIGIAAPQIGENYQIFVTEPRKTETRTGDQVDELRVYINPKIIKSSRSQSVIYEGCGCVANGTLFGPVKRPKNITIRALDVTNQNFELQCDGILARVIQHEYDHLEGIEFTEKIMDYRKLLNVDMYIQTIRNSKEQKEASIITVKKVKSA